MTNFKKTPKPPRVFQELILVKWQKACSKDSELPELLADFFRHLESLPKQPELFTGDLIINPPLYFKQFPQLTKRPNGGFELSARFGY